MTLILGLTGGIATGKSTVSNYFKKLGIPVIDADVGSRIIVEPGTDGLKKIEKYFGDNILKQDGTLDRKELGEIVFNDKIQLTKLNAILDEHIRKWMTKQIVESLRNNPPLIVLDIPLLYENNYLSEVDLVMVVTTTKDVQLKRLMERDKISEKSAKTRIIAQLSIENKTKKADIVIDNNNSIKETQNQVHSWLTQNKLIK